MNIVIRPYQPGDLEALRRITVESFDGVSFDQLVESKFGILHGHDWRWRKARHIDDDVNSNAAGTFVAEADGQVVGYITTHLDRGAGKARIPNLAITAEARGQGLGRRLIQRALDYLRREGAAYAMIETVAGNEVGEHLYPSWVLLKLDGKSISVSNCEAPTPPAEDSISGHHARYGGSIVELRAPRGRQAVAQVGT